MNIKNIFSLLIITFFSKKINSTVYKIKSIPAKTKTLRNLSEDHFLSRAFGDSYDLNYYYATLYVGKDKTPQTYILDTGSGITTSPCNKCTDCGNSHFNVKFEINDEKDIINCKTDQCSILASNACDTNKQCAFSISYSEGSSLGGFFVNQNVYFENLNSESKISGNFYNIPLGCTTKETHLFRTQLADGIMGLSNIKRSFINILFSKKIIKKDLFTICFAQKDGYFSMGEIDNTYHLEKQIKYVPLTSPTGNYYINLKKITFANKEIQNTYTAFIDSGTTISYFPRSIYNAIITEFKTFCENKECGKFQDVKSLGYCGFFNTKEKLLYAINNLWPNITFYFEGYNYVLLAKDYYFEYKDGNNFGACLGFEGEGASRLTLGGTFMHGHDIIFDKANNRIGFAVADCNRGENKKSNENKEQKKESKYENDNKNINTNINTNGNDEKNNENKEPEKSSDNEKNFKNKFNKIFNPESDSFYILILFSTFIIVIVIVILLILLRTCKFKKKTNAKYYPQIDSDTQKKDGVNVIEVK